MALQGTLDTFALADVLHLLAATKKTGCLHLDSTRGAGSVWVDSGQIVGIAAVQAPHATGPAEAMFELLRFEDGSFQFEADARAHEPSAPTEVDELLNDAGVLLAEWREIEAVVPSLDTRTTLARTIEAHSVTVTAALWPALVAVAGGTTVRALGQALGLGELPVSRAVRDLVELGVVELTTNQAAAPAPMPTPEPAAAEPVVVPDPTIPAESVETFDAEPEPAELMAEAAPEVPFEPAPLSAPLAPVAKAAEHGLPPVAWAADEFDHDSRDQGSVGSTDPGELPVARPIKARKAKSRLQESTGAEPERFVPLDLPGHMGSSPATAFAADEDDAGTDDGQLDDLAAAFPGLASRVGAGEDDELAQQLAVLSPRTAEALRAAADADTDEERDAALDAAVEGEGGPINRGLLLKFLSSVKS